MIKRIAVLLLVIACSPQIKDCGTEFFTYSAVFNETARHCIRAAAEYCTPAQYTAIKYGVHGGFLNDTITVLPSCEIHYERFDGVIVNSPLPHTPQNTTYGCDDLRMVYDEFTPEESKDAGIDHWLYLELSNCTDGNRTLSRIGFI